MAKLSAHGVEYARLSLGTDVADDDHVERREVHYSFRSDGHIMRKLIVVFRNRTYDKRHDYGWKIWKKSSDTSREHMVGMAERFAEKYDGDLKIGATL